MLAGLVATIHSAQAAGPRPPPARRSPLPRPAARETAVARLLNLTILPARAQLTNADDRQKLLVTAHFADGAQRDVSDQARFESKTPKIVQVSTEGVATPRGDGAGVVMARWGGRMATVSVATQNARRPVTVSFVHDVVPVLSRLGCSQGACHGAAQGKGGFRLSLRGYAPEIDWVSITRQLGGRRITREAPERSLFLRKPLMETPHRGGKRLDVGTREYALLLTWLRQGASGPTGTEPALARLDLLPGDREMRPGEKQRLVVRATFADGRTRDVTDRALYNTNDVALVTTDGTGLITMQRAGETAITAKYMDKLAVMRVVSPYSQKIAPAAYAGINNFIDTAVNGKLRQLHLEPSGLCGESEFLRRAYLDAIGTLPTVAETTAFLADARPDKRDRLIDALLQRPEYGQVWALKFGDLFVLRREYMHRKYAMVMQQWLAEQFNANRPWNQVATDILTASGSLDDHRGGLFFVSRAPQKPNEEFWIRAPEATAEMSAQVFLGARIQCAKCHNHPSERTTQDYYYHYVGLWQQVTGKGDNDDGVPETLAATASGDVRQPRTGEIMTARPLDRADLNFAKTEDRRVKTARWIIGQDAFARNIVNRYWARCFGVGIVEPVDDIRSTNPATNEPLMRALCDDLRAHDFDLKRLLSLILRSRTYQRSAVPTRRNQVDTRLCSHYPARRMPAEELADAVAQVTGAPDRYQGSPLGARALELADAEIPSVMLDTFGRPPRVQPSDSERACQPAMSQALALLNSQEVQQKLKAPEGTLAVLLKSGKPDKDILDTLFLSALARHATPAESKALLNWIARTPKREEGFQDALWALLNSKEFLFDH